MEFFGTEHPSRGPAETQEQRAGRCYELAGHALLLGSAPRDSLLIHGTIEGFGNPRFGHAWLLLPDFNNIWEPMQAKIWPLIVWRGIANPKVNRTYSYEELQRFALKFEHWGPWHD